jgi:hypothetical protein
VAVDARNLRGREGELGVRGFGGGDVHEEGLAFWFGSVSERIENIKGVGWAIVFFLGGCEAGGWDRGVGRGGLAALERRIGRSG